jgi:hypothetical protein
MADGKNSTAQMSPEDLQAAMSAIVAHETGAAPAASVAAPDAAPDAAPARTTDDQIADAIAKQRQAELDQVASEQTRRDAMNPVARQYEDIKGLLPEPMRQSVDYGAEALGGVLTGQAIKSATKAIFPQYVPGTPENLAAEANTTGFKTAQEKHEQAQAQLKAHEPVVQSHEQAVQEHANELRRMEARAQALHDAHEMATRDLHAARAEQSVHKIRDPAMELHEQMGPPPQQESAPKAKEKDYYGRNDRRWTSSNETSAANAARNRQTTSTLGAMGLNPDEAISKAPGMSSTKSGVLAPSEIVEPQLAQENAAHQAELEQREQQKRIIIKQIAAAQAAADARVESMHERQKAAADALKEHRAALKAHMSAAPAMPSAVERARQTALENEAEYNRLLAKRPNAQAPQDSNIVKGLRIAGNVGKRYIPGIGAALAPFEAEQAYEDYKKGNYLRAGAHGLGAAGAVLQATGLPPVMGVGNLMQTPSLGYGIYDALNYGNLTGPK